MENVFLSIILALILGEVALLMFCDYWRAEHPWKWFIYKSLTTAFIVIWFCWAKDSFDLIEMSFAFILGAGMGIDFVGTYIHANNIKIMD